MATLTCRFQTIPGQSEQARTLDKVKSVTWCSLKPQKKIKKTAQPTNILQWPIQRVALHPLFPVDFRNVHFEEGKKTG